MEQNVVTDLTVCRGQPQSIHYAFHKHMENSTLQPETANLYVIPRTNPLKDGVSEISWTKCTFDPVGTHMGEEGNRGGLECIPCKKRKSMNLSRRCFLEPCIKMAVTKTKGRLRMNMLR